MLVKFTEFLCDCDLCESLNVYFEEKIEKSNPGHLVVAFCDNVPRNSIYMSNLKERFLAKQASHSKARAKLQCAYLARLLVCRRCISFYPCQNTLLTHIKSNI